MYGYVIVGAFGRVRAGRPPRRGQTRNHLSRAKRARGFELAERDDSDPRQPGRLPP